jgi:hypothetical protein
MATFGTFTSAVLTAAELNTAGGAWTTYAPTYTNFSLGNGTLAAAKYEQIGRSVHVKVEIVLGSTSSVTGLIGISLPVTGASSGADSCGMITETGTGNKVAFVIWSTTRADLYYLDAAAAITATSATVPHTWGDTDVFRFHFTYEAAADGT